MNVVIFLQALKCKTDISNVSPDFSNFMCYVVFVSIEWAACFRLSSEFYMLCRVELMSDAT